MRALLFLKRYWYLPLLIVGLVALFFILKGRKAPEEIVKRIKKELDAIKAGTDAHEVLINEGAEAATKHVKEKYQAKQEALDEKQKAKVAKLENDPEALANYLDRL